MLETLSIDIFAHIGETIAKGRQYYLVKRKTVKWKLNDNGLNVLCGCIINCR